MSRAYRIRLSESLRRHIEVDDGICSSLELLDVLPREQMAELLARELEGAGFEEREGQWVRVDADGWTVSTDARGRNSGKPARCYRLKPDSENTR